MVLGVGLSHGVEMTLGVECGVFALGVGPSHGVEMTLGVECGDFALGVGLSQLSVFCRILLDRAPSRFRSENVSAF